MANGITFEGLVGQKLPNWGSQRTHYFSSSYGDLPKNLFDRLEKFSHSIFFKISSFLPNHSLINRAKRLPLESIQKVLDLLDRIVFFLHQRKWVKEIEKDLVKTINAKGHEFYIDGRRLENLTRDDIHKEYEDLSHRFSSRRAYDMLNPMLLVDQSSFNRWFSSLYPMDEKLNCEIVWGQGKGMVPRTELNTIEQVRMDYREILPHREAFVSEKVVQIGLSVFFKEKEAICYLPDPLPKLVFSKSSFNQAIFA